jgi:protein-disulfide isomerase
MRQGVSSYLLLVVLVGLAAASGCGPASTPTPAAAPPASGERMGNPDAYNLVNDPAIGPSTAPVVIQEYGDYSCIQCAVWEEKGIRKQLLDKYGNQIRFVWHDYAVLTPQSRPSSLAARCAGDQGKYWEYHDILYDHYPALEDSDLKRYASNMGLDTTAFNQCLDAQTHFDALGAGLQDGMNKGFFATPAFLVNSTAVFGGETLDYFEKIIDPILAHAQPLP